MAAITTPARPVAPPVPRWALLALAAAVGVLWMVSFEGGALSELVGNTGSFLHELFHDGRHLVGVPCH